MIPIGSSIDIFAVLTRGLQITITVMISSAILSYIVAFIAGFARTSRLRLVRGTFTVIVEFFRGTSLLVQLFWFYFVLPIPSFWAATLAIGLNYGSYMSEVVRGSVLAVPKGQTEASISLNMSKWQRLRLVILPQAIRMMLPEFGNYMIQMLKATSLVSLVGLADMTYHGMIYRNSNTGEALAVFSIMLVAYFLLAQPLIALVRWFEKQASKGVARG